MQDIEKMAFVEKVKKFCELEKNFCQLLEKSAELNLKEVLSKLTQLAVDAFEQKNLIELDLAQNDYAAIQVDDAEIKKTINNIPEWKKFASIYGYELFSKALNENLAKDDKNNQVDDLDFASFKFDDLFRHFHSWFDISGYYVSKLQVGPIITTKPIPKELEHYFIEIRDAYAFGLRKSCISLCRALLEICLINDLSKIDEYRKKLEKLRKKGRRKDFSLFENIESGYMYKLFDEKLKDDAHIIRNSANDILHFSNNMPPSSSGSLLDIIRKTVAIVEHLYK